MRHVKPMHDRIICRRLPEPDQTILLTDREKYQVCEVLAVGPGRWIDGEFVRTSVKPGDKVILPGWGGQTPDYELEDGSFIAQQGDIGAIICH
ncbi:MAG TPA: co-chaperone GroES [Ktedonobacteraceae bacterium]|nr:co-chaperone GroES [Ktedonobacteraceae bacterium]